MAKSTVDEIIQQIKALDCEELKELIRAIEDTFFVSTGMKEDVTCCRSITEPSYTLSMVSCGPHRGRVISLLREHFGCSLYLARQFVDEKNIRLSKSGPMSEGDMERELRPLLDELDALGAVVRWSFDWGDYE